jgi:enoyl-[acyl-carrier protein] reductase II
MMFISKATLVAAFSEAGGLGCLAAAGMKEMEFHEQIEEIKKRTGRPFAVNIPWVASSSMDLLQWCLDDHIDVIISSAGAPPKGLEKLKQAGKTVFQVVANVSQAVNAESMGADGIIAKGYESGGLNSLEAVASLPLVPQVANAVSVPVIAAGGIGDGRGVAAVLALGAEGAQMGTRFLASHECPIPESYKRALVKASDTDTIELRLPGFSVRLWKNQRALGLKGNESLWELISSPDEGGETGEKLWSAGQIAGLIKSLSSVEQIFQEILEEFEASVRRLQKFAR